MQVLGSIQKAVSLLISLVSKGVIMSKYEMLWKYVSGTGKASFKLSYTEIENIAGVPIDHSFLTYKKELVNYGYKVGKISMKEQSVEFIKI